MTAPQQPGERHRETAVLRLFEELFSGGPDTSCRTIWRESEQYPECSAAAVECVEVPMADLRETFDRAAALAAAEAEGAARPRIDARAATTIATVAVIAGHTVECMCETCERLAYVALPDWAEKRAEGAARYEALWESVREARRQAWNDGYDAAKNGQQRRNPFRALLGADGDTGSGT